MLNFMVFNFVASLFFNIVKKLQKVILKFCYTVFNENSYCKGSSGSGTATLIFSLI
jgi:hypothetical protein